MLFIRGRHAKPRTGSCRFHCVKGLSYQPRYLTAKSDILSVLYTPDSIVSVRTHTCMHTNYTTVNTLVDKFFSSFFQCSSQNIGYGRDM